MLHVVSVLLSLLLHDFFVPARPFERSEREAAGGGVVKRDADAPQIHRGAVFLLVVFSQHGSLVHVRVLRRKHMKKTTGSSRLHPGVLQNCDEHFSCFLTS